MRTRLSRLSLVAAIVATLSLATLAGVAWAANTNVDVVHRSEGEPFAYAPDNVTIAPGDTITFRNPVVHSDGASATEHPTSCRKETSRGKTKGECPWTTEDVDPGTSTAVTFPKEGTFQYLCIVHPYMIGTIVVGDGEPGDPPPPPSPSPTATTKPSPTATAKPSPTATTSSAPSPTATTGSPTATASDAPVATATASDTPTAGASPDASPDPVASASSSPSPDADDDDDDDDAADDDDGDDDGEDDDGTGLKVLASLLVVGTGAGLARFRRA